MSSLNVFIECPPNTIRNNLLNEFHLISSIEPLDAINGINSGD